MAKSKFHTGTNHARDALNAEIQMKFRDWLADIDPDTNLEFILTHLEHGTKQWSDKTNCNVCVFNALCPHICLYCYASINAVNKFGVDARIIRNRLLEQGFDIFSLKKVEFNDKESLRSSFQLDPSKICRDFMKSSNPYLIMLPSSHDLFPETLEQTIAVQTKHGKTKIYTYIGFLQALMDAGHELLITLKPRLAVVQQLCKKLHAYKEKIVFRFTITSDDPTILAFWETFAPDFNERMASLEHAFTQGYHTTVSMEPFLTDPHPVIKAIRPYASQIWLGIIDKIPQKKLLGLDITGEPDVLAELVRLRELYSIDRVKDLVFEFRNDEKVFWKSSIILAMIVWKKRLHPSTTMPSTSPTIARLEDFI